MAEIDYRALAEQAGLSRVGARLPLGQYVAEAWRRRQFVITLAKYRLQAELGRNRLGLLWMVLRPLMLVAVYGAVFGLVMPAGTRPDNFVAYLVVGVFMFEFFSRSLVGGSYSITGNAGLVKSLVFPRIILPASVVVGRLFETLPMIGVMAVVLVVFGEPIGWEWLLVIPILLLMTLFNFGMAALAARVTVHVRDATQVLPFVSRILFYTSGIFYSLDKVLASRPDILFAAQFNPVSGYISMTRHAVVEGVEVGTVALWAAIAAAIVTPVVGLVYFWRAEERYGLD